MQISIYKAFIFELLIFICCILNNFNFFESEGVELIDEPVGGGDEALEDGGGAEGVFVDDVLVGFGVAAGVVDVPAEGEEEGVEELAAELGFVEGGGVVGIAVALEGVDESPDGVGWVHGNTP